MKKSLVLLLITLALAAYVWYFEVREKSRVMSTNQADQMSKTVVGAETQDIKGFTLAKEGQEPISVQQVNEAWVMTRPVDAPAEESTVKGILWDLEWAEKETTIPAADVTGDKIKAYGLDKPQGYIDVTVAGTQQSRTLHLIIGGANLGGASVYVRNGDDGPVYVVKKNFADNLNTTIFQLRNKTLVYLAPAQVGYAKINGATKAVIEKRDGEWNLADPYKDYADDETVNSFLKDAAALTVAAFVSDDTSTFAEYGLAEPASYIVIAEGVSSGKSYTVNFGNRYMDEASGEERVYAAAGGHSVYSLKASAVDKLFPTVEALQYKTLVRLDPYMLKKLTLTYGLDEVQLAKPDFDWKVVRPYEAGANAAEVTKIVAAFQQAPVGQYIPDDPDTDKYGVKTPRASFSYTEADKAPVGVVFGTDAGNDMVYVRRTDTPGVYRVPKSILDLPATPALRFHTFDMEAVVVSNVDTLKLTRRDGTFVVKRVNNEIGRGSWKMLDPVEAPANTSMITALAASLANIKAAMLIERNPSDLAQYGLDSPGIRVDFQMNKGVAETPKPLLVGAKAPEGARFAMLEGGDIVFTIGSGFAKMLSDEVRDVDIYAFEPAEATRIEFIRGGDTMALNKDGDSWAVESPAGATANQSAVKGELARLSVLTATRFVSYKTAELSKYALDKPVAVVRVTTPSGVAALSIGSTSDTGHYYAASTTVDGIFLLIPMDIEAALNPSSLLESAGVAAGTAGAGE